MKYKAVIFDLYGTLTHYTPFLEYENVVRRIASVISAPAEDFLRIWHDTFDKQLRGDLPNDQATIQHICQVLNVPVKDEHIKTAAQLKFDIAKREITTLRVDVEEVLLYLKSEGYKIGLISN